MKRFLAALLTWLKRKHRPSPVIHQPIPPSLIARRLVALGRSVSAAQYQQALRLAELEKVVQGAVARLGGYRDAPSGPARQRERALRDITEFTDPALGSYRSFLDCWPPQSPGERRLLDLAEEILRILATRAHTAAELCAAYEAADSRLCELEREYGNDLPETWARLVAVRKVRPRLAGAQSGARIRGVMKELGVIAVALGERQEFYRRTMGVGDRHTPLEPRGTSLEHLWWDGQNGTLSRAVRRWRIVSSGGPGGYDDTNSPLDFGGGH